MTKERLVKIRQSVANDLREADNIMDGGDNYDGADGARTVQELCGLCEELIAALEKLLPQQEQAE